VVNLAASLLKLSQQMYNGNVLGQPKTTSPKFAIRMNSTTEYTISFIFRRVSPSMRENIIEFWEEHREDWLSITRQPETRNIFTVQNTQTARSSALLQNAVCVAQANSGAIAGVAWIKVAMMPVDTNKSELIYFQRMYIAPEHRCVRLANQLINAFHHHLILSNQRSPLVKYLLAENTNPKLKTPVGRRLFIRRGFKFIGFNSYDNEIWKLALPPTTGPSCLPVFR
jgi:hypothetical protein